MTAVLGVSRNGKNAPMTWIAAKSGYFSASRAALAPIVAAYKSRVICPAGPIIKSGKYGTTGANTAPINAPPAAPLHAADQLPPLLLQASQKPKPAPTTAPIP